MVAKHWNALTNGTNDTSENASTAEIKTFYAIVWVQALSSKVSDLISL